MDLSIVTTLYRSELYINDFYERVSRSAKKITDDYEIIFVNDGSPDTSLEKALAIFNSDKKVKIVDFSCNQGHHKALMTGLKKARGGMVFMIDSDLEEKPELLELFYEYYRNNHADVVLGIQQHRKGGLFERWSGKVFYSVFNWFSDVKIPDNQLTVRLMSRRYVNALTKFKDKNVFLAGLMQLAGFTQLPVAIKKEDKKSSSYTLRKKIDLLINAITSFSEKPLVLIFQSGVVITLFSLLTGLFFLIKKLFWGIEIPGWTSLALLIFFFSGIIVFFQGIIGIYLAKIYIETKKRPYTTIREYYENIDKSEG